MLAFCRVISTIPLKCFFFHHLEDDDAVSTIEVSPDIGPTIKANATSMMEAAIAALSGELNKLRTGRASPGTLSHRYLLVFVYFLSMFVRFIDTVMSENVSTGMLDHIIVELDGVKMPLSHLAVVSVMDSKTLSVNPYDPNVMNKNFT